MKFITEKIYIYILIVLFFSISNASATIVELDSNEELPSKLHEGEKINFTINIYDFNYQEANFIEIETNLGAYEDEPIYDFGELNKYINSNRYEQNIEINLSSLPQQDHIYVTISGQAPNGEIKIPTDGNYFNLIKFQDGKLKFYDISLDDKPVDTESFELIIAKKEKFEKTMQQIKWDELNGLKLEVRNFFNIGLVTEAQNLATLMSEIERPDYLVLFGFIEITSIFWLNMITIGLIFFTFIAGFWLSSKLNNEEE